MSFTDLYESGQHGNNVAHFASLVNIAAVDGELNDEEKALIQRFARKLDITESEYATISQAPGKYPINPPTSSAVRLERIYDLFRIVYADHQIDDEELRLVKRYATGLGYADEQADTLIKKSIKIFGGQIDFEDYEYLLSK